MSSVLTPGEMLLQAYDQRRLLNPRFSMRTFAEKIELSPAFLSLLIAGKRSLSQTRAVKIVRSLKFDSDTAELFLICNTIHKIKNETEKKQYVDRIEPLLSNQLSYKTLTIELEAMLSDPTSIELLCFIELVKDKDALKKISTLMNRSEEAIKIVLDRLIKFGVIYISDGCFLPTNQYRLFKSRRSSSIRNYHKHYLIKAADALEQQLFDERDYRGTTLTFDIESMDLVKFEIEKLHKTLLKISENSKESSVYHLATQFFRIGESL